MADRESALVVKTEFTGIDELREGDTFNTLSEDAARAPQFEKRIYLIKTLNGAQMFEADDPKGGDRVKVNEVRGVLIHFNSTRSWWEKSLDDGGGGSAPDCHSVDGVRPLPTSVKKQCDTCAACPMNRFVKEGKKTTKQCSDKVELFLWHPKYDLPLFYRVSTMNRPVVTDFISWCKEQGLSKEFYTLKLTLAKTRNKGGVEYDKLVIEPTGTIRDLVQWYKSDQNLNLTWKEIRDSIAFFKDDNADSFGMALGEENATPAAKAPTDAKKTEAKPATVDAYAVGREEPPF